MSRELFDDPYVYPGTDVLRNKRELRDPEALRHWETEVVAARSADLILRPIQGHLDLAHLRAIHRRLFGDVYEWAGELRTIDISKGNSAFAPTRTAAHTLESWGNAVFRELERENHLQGLPLDRFAARLAYHYSEINYLHPFRKGNGRATPVFVEQLAECAGYDLDLKKVDRTRWINASIAGDNSDLEPLRVVFAEAAMPLRAAASLSRQRRRAVAGR